MPLAKDRNTAEALGDVFEFGQAAATTLYAGALAMLNASGFVTPGAVATGQICAGRVQERSVNAGAAGAVRAKVKRGNFWWKNSAAADLIAITEIGDDCFILDDETVAKTNGSNTRSVAGKVLAVDANLGVLVRTGLF
tara:strand:+ start:25804 stop:26217 length:414 start_codon:yes stop_codon:yes gene_type:complete